MFAGCDQSQGSRTGDEALPAGYEGLGDRLREWSMFCQRGYFFPPNPFYLNFLCARRGGKQDLVEERGEGKEGGDEREEGG